ncbi:MAG: glycosyltransferase family 2 protein, partial [Polyangiales bacterium]
MGVGEQLKGALEAIVPESRAPEVTLVVPGLNEAESLPLLAAQVKEALGTETSYELIFVDDGSTDGTWQVIQDLNESDPAVRGIRLRSNFGKAMALSAGFERARADIVVMMDADLQDDPADLPKMLEKIRGGLD